MKRVNRICGIVRNLSLIGMTVLWAIIGEFGVYRTPIGFSCAVAVFIAFLIPAIISERIRTCREEQELAEYEKSLDEGIKNGSITEEKLKEMADEAKDKIKTNERSIRKNNIIMFGMLIIAAIIAVFALSCSIMTVPDIFCTMILVWPSFQISGAIKARVKKILERKEYCHEKC